VLPGVNYHAGSAAERARSDWLACAGRAYATRTSDRNRLTWPARSRDCEDRRPRRANARCATGVLDRGRRDLGRGLYRGQ
jgi:hypothetical protein